MHLCVFSSRFHVMYLNRTANQQEGGGKNPKPVWPDLFLPALLPPHFGLFAIKKKKKTRAVCFAPPLFLLFNLCPLHKYLYFTFW